MPKIKAHHWKGGNVLIPVDESEIVTAYQCRKTNELFKNKRSFLANLRNRRKEIHAAIQKNNMRKMIHTELRTLESFNDIVGWIESHSAIVWDIANDHAWPAKKPKKHRETFWLRIDDMDLTYLSSISNKRVCPHNGVRNQDRVEHEPLGYPGWFGSIQFTTNYSHPEFVTAFDEMGLYIDGCRGGRIEYRKGHHPSYMYHGMIMFHDDWCGIKSSTIAKRLAGETNPKFKHSLF